MLLVDTSVWIDLLSKKPSFRLKPEQLFQLCVCPPVIQELLQGFPADNRYILLQDSILALPCLSPTVATELYIQGAEIFRAGRRRGKTIRSSVDCLIAAIAIANKVTVWHKDRDFDAIATYTDLLVTAKPSPG
jgi:predicted nucleic acid-binding protein